MTETFKTIKAGDYQKFKQMFDEKLSKGIETKRDNQMHEMGKITKKNPKG